MSTVFYISGHGFGHAVRQIAVIDALLRRAPRQPVFVHTTAPAWLFARLPSSRVTRVPVETDTGMVQIDALRLDEPESIARALAFHETIEARAAAEAERLRDRAARLVICDAPALGCAAAALAGIPAVVCANFTWDWIYAAYADVEPRAALAVQAVREAYGTAHGWRLPLGGGFESFEQVVDVPLIARHPRGGATHETREALGLPIDRPLALVSFGGFGVADLPLDRLDCTRDYGIVVTSRRAHLEGVPDGVYGVSEELLATDACRYEDLVAAVDAVISKPGYGIIADCISTGTALVHTPRGRFREYDVLMREMPEILRSAPLTMDDFLMGRWKDALDAAMRQGAPARTLRTDGAAVVAEMIVERLA